MIESIISVNNSQYNNSVIIYGGRLIPIRHLVTNLISEDPTDLRIKISFLNTCNKTRMFSKAVYIVTVLR
jgi:hypothetical protein